MTLTTIITAAALALGGFAPATPDTVTTSGGQVRGTTTAEVRSFQGIPYAAPPVGPLRWRLPQPAAAWTGVRDATTPGSPCPQVSGGNEDCLFLNVHTPRRTPKPLPVLVYLHGGGFVGGDGASYDPTRLVTKGQVVVVTLNYRLGALGFLAHPQLGERNFGLADQQAALRWVRRNIAAFGGDAGNVTLWGQSAGAVSTCAQLSTRGLFDRAIVQSGPCNNPLVTQQVAEQRGVETTAELGCADVECLRGLDAKALVGLHQDQVFTVHRHTAEMPWLPVAGPPSPRRVPLMLGGTKDEMRPFVAATYPSITAAQYPTIVGDLYGTDADAVLAAYPADRYPTPKLALATLLTDEGGMHGACSQLSVKPTYSYEFAEPTDYAVGDFPYGAAHGTDVAYFFDTPFGPPLTPAQQVLADRMIGYWATFARGGVPWTASTWSLVAAGDGPVDLAREHRCEFWREHRG
jgi:para-nitrobenzyl esterase